jgi:hypothetical protein
VVKIKKPRIGVEMNIGREMFLKKDENTAHRYFERKLL